MEASAIVLAAGAGTRMKSNRPKVAHDLLGKSLVRWVVDAAHKAGITDVVCVLGHLREQVEPLVDYDTTIVVQEQLVGTADAVKSCQAHFEGKSGSVLVLSGDCPLITPETLTSLVQAREESDAGVVVLTMEAEDPYGYGRIVRNDAGMIERIVEQKDCNEQLAQITECNSGFYCFDIELLFKALQEVGSNNAQGEYYLTDVIEIARNQGRATVGFKAHDPRECQGINTRLQLAAATQFMQQRINEAYMLEGVTMLDPTSVWIGADAVVESDVELLPQTMLYGTTHIGSGSVVGPNTRLTNTTVGCNCHIEETVAIDAQIDDDCSCGPRAYLRPGAHLMQGAKAGTHVEIKKSTVGPGSKVPHLSYIGDATIGSNVNIGAGTITCNYDGKNKWATTIGNDVFVGSDTMLVAPVEVGDGALIGAGSVITDDVPAGALALGRARQTTLPDRVAQPKDETDA